MPVLEKPAYSSCGVLLTAAVLILHRIPQPGFLEAFQSKQTGVAVPTGGPVGGRRVAGARQAVVDSESGSLGDDLGLREMQQRGVECQLAMDSTACFVERFAIA